MACHPFDMETDCQPASQPDSQPPVQLVRESELGKLEEERDGTHSATVKIFTFLVLLCTNGVP